MNLFSELKIGEKLLIEPISHSKHIYTNKHIVSQLIDISHNMLIISNPILRGINYVLHLGQEVRIIFFREEKGVYMFTCQVEFRGSKEIPLYGLRPVSKPEKIQRRYYYRLPCTYRALIKGLNENNGMECFTKDLSGGGVKLICKREFPLGSMVECIIELGNNEKITVVGKVIRTEPIPEHKEISVAVQFNDVCDEIVEKIVSFIFKKQRELRKKGLI